jgi:hypothetical protein
MKKWLRETHGPWFELLRHFLSRFLDSDFITAPGQTSKMLIAGTPVFFLSFFLLVDPLYRKYAYLAALPGREACRQAVQADELWLITLMMSAIGLLAALKWQLLFPDLRDYRVLGTLPLRSRQIFGAKLAALVLVAMAALLTLNFLPTAIFPILSAKCCEGDSSSAARAWAHAEASLGACAFFFFGLVAIQGVLLNLLPPRAFGRLTRNLQGILAATMLALVVASFSVEPKMANALLRPAWARWLPPIWFLGLYQNLSGNRSLEMNVLAHRAVGSLALVLSLTLLTYGLSYRRRRALPVEENVSSARSRYVGRMLPDWLGPNPRQQAIWAFMMKGLMRSSYHRVILMSYAGFATAVLLLGFLGMNRVFEPTRAVPADFVYYHIVTLIFLLIAARHIFSRPIELRANWIFQITEREGRVAWMIAMDRFVLFWGAILILVLPFPFEFRLLGWRGVAETGLFMALGLLSYDWFFSSWEKLPFTCSHLPGKLPAWILLASLGLLEALSLLHRFLLAILYIPVGFGVVLALLLVAWTYMRRDRRKAQVEFRLQYDDVPEPAVRELKLLRS